MRPKSIVLSILLLFSVANCSLFAGTLTIDTLSEYLSGSDFGSSTGSWGNGSAFSTWGQTITAPAGAVTLDSFSFLLLDVSPTALPFYAYVMEWDGSKAIGGVLYKSALSQVPVGEPAGFEELAFLPNISVSPGSQYVLFFSTSETDRSVEKSTAFAFRSSSVYAGGIQVELWSPDPSFWTFPTYDGTHLFDGWNTGSANALNDLAFRASFTTASATPEPASWLCFLAGAFVISLRLRRSAAAGGRR